MSDLRFPKRPPPPEPSGEELWRRIMWQPSYWDCHTCSSWKTQTPARYEVWFETTGYMVTDEYPPECCLQTMCEECATECRDQHAEGRDAGMKLLIVRDLRRGDTQGTK